MKQTACCLILVVLLAGCKPREEKPSETPQQPAETLQSKLNFTEPDASNLLTMARGAVVIYRSGELQLESSAIHAIDNTATTSWITPPNDPGQSLTIALPTRTLVTNVGLFAPFVPGNSRRPLKIKFETSEDGQAFQTVAIFETPKSGSGTVPAKPAVEATFLRATILDTEPTGIAIPTLVMEGKESAEYKRPSVGGRWRLNELEGSFSEDGSRVRARIDQKPSRMTEGGWSGRTTPFIFLRGRAFGYGITAVAPDGRHLNSKWWFEEAIPLFAASPWFGERISEAATINVKDEVLDTWLERFGFVPLYGLSFDEVDRLAGDSGSTRAWLAETIRKRSGQRLRVVAREYRRANADANRQSAERQIEAVRRFLTDARVDLTNVTFAALGTTEHKETPGDLLEKTVYSRIELQVQK